MNGRLIIQIIEFLILQVLKALGFRISDERMEFEDLKIEAYKENSSAQYQLAHKIMHDKSLINIGTNYGRDIAKDEKEALKWLNEAANQGHEKARYKLGMIYERGEKTIPADERIALEWYEKAGYQGHPEAQQKLVKMYKEGKGTRKDDSQAQEWEERLNRNDRKKYIKLKEDLVKKAIENRKDRGVDHSDILEKYQRELREGPEK